MTTHTNPFNRPKAGGVTATTEDRVAELEDTIYRALDELRTMTSRAVPDTDTTYLVAKVLAGVKRTVETRYKPIRTTLWEKFGVGKHATPAGRTFSFTKPVSTRRCDYDALAKQFPEAYEAVVTLKTPSADAVGTLRLSGK